MFGDAATRLFSLPAITHPLARLVSDRTSWYPPNLRQLIKTLSNADLIVPCVAGLTQQPVDLFHVYASVDRPLRGLGEIKETLGP
jgi:hypothetical protein